MAEARTLQWDPARYAEHARFVSELGMPVVDLLSPRPGERILDLGCGDGVLSATLVDLGCRITGVDSSSEMVAAAVARGVDARVMDGGSLEFSEDFDAVFSNAALHWMTEPDRVIDGVWRALKPGGRFVAEMGGDGNVATIVAAVESALARHGVTVGGLWFFPTAESYRARLQRRGFVVQEISLFERPTPLPGDISGWLETFLQAHLQALPTKVRPAVVSAIVDELRPKLCDSSGQWNADYVRLRFRADKPA